MKTGLFAPAICLLVAGLTNPAAAGKVLLECRYFWRVQGVPQRFEAPYRFVIDEQAGFMWVANRAVDINRVRLERNNGQYLAASGRTGFGTSILFAYDKSTDRYSFAVMSGTDTPPAIHVQRGVCRRQPYPF